MTPGIMHWLQHVAAPKMNPPPTRVVEIGAFNVNGRARDGITGWTTWHGWDHVTGPDVAFLGPFFDTGQVYELVIACECYEHDKLFWKTNKEARRVVFRNRGHYVVTTPANGFPYHSYGGDFYRFTEDTYRQVFFPGMEILDLRTIGEPGMQTVCGIARVR